MDELNGLDPDLLFDDDLDPFDLLPETVHSTVHNNTAVHNNNTVHNNTTVHNSNTTKAAEITDSLDALLNDDDDFPDFDADELVKAAENAERGHQQATINPFERAQDAEHGDPTPPAPLPAHTANFHKFDNQKLCTWVYPMNYPTRNYQLNMVKKGLFQNTLIALPTGLGKTFIAAVIMFNYWRWFPESKVIFLAPTRPLVAQQIEACYKICGLPQADTIEMTGHMPVPKRAEHWKTKRVFFMTPQTMQNDLEKHICPANAIACLVVDEAHKATGNYAFVEVVRLIAKAHSHFRVLALTATPGSNLDNVQTVVNNLHINNIQIRTEESMDIQEYTHGKQIQRIVVRLSYVEGATGVLPRAINTFHSQVFVPLLKELLKFNAIQTDDPSKNTPFGLMQARQRFRENARNMTNYIRNKVTMTFMTCEALSRANDLLCNHGVAPFVDCIEGINKQVQESVNEGKGVIPSDRAITAHPELKRLMGTLKREMNMPGFIGHPKMERLVNILLDHFTNSDSHSKVMIFSSYRNSVDEICRALSIHHPMIRCSEFVGQASGRTGTKGLKQAEQQQIITRFKNDELNTLVSTSIGEEGLDIGEVDLIVCYDSQSSPIRMLQRMGRTGRRRKGRCILLLTESEDKKYSTAKETYSRVQQLIARGSSIRYHNVIPSVIPDNYKPTMSRQKLTFGAYVPIVKNKRGAKVDEQDYTFDGKMKEQTLNHFVRSFPDTGLTTLDALINHYWPIQSFKTKLNTTIPIQKDLQRTHSVGHSKTTKYFTACIRRMEHRILHPGKDVPTTSIVPQKKLIMPKRHKPLEALTNPSKKQKKATLDDHFEHYMQHVEGMSFLLDQPGPSKPRRDSIDELLKDVVLDEERAVNDLIDDNFEASYHDIKGKRRVVEPILNPRKKTKTMDHSLSNKHHGLEHNIEKSSKKSALNEELDQRSWSSILPASSPNDDPINATPIKDTPIVDQLLPSMNQEFGDDGDSFDDAIFTDAALEKWDDVAAFNEDLPPVYPFEKPQPSPVQVSCIFPPEGPTFSEKGIALLKQKYKSLRNRGDTMLVKIITRLISNSPQCSPKMDSDDNYSFGDNVDFEEMLKKVDLNNMMKEPIMIEDSQPSEKPIEEPQEAPIDEEFGDAFDFDDELLVNIMENKGLDMEGGGAEEISYFLESQFQKSFTKPTQTSQKTPAQLDTNKVPDIPDIDIEETQPKQHTEPIKEEEEEEILIFSSLGADQTVLMSKSDEDSDIFITEGPSQTQKDIQPDFNSSPILHSKKKKGRILMDLDSSEDEPLVKQKVIHRKVDSDDDFGEPQRLKDNKMDSNDDDFDEPLLTSTPKKKHIKQMAPNPFIEMEAERSEDDISEDEEENGVDEELDDSFINDEISFMTQGPHLQQVSPVAQRWMRGFHAEKWLQPQEDDSIVEEESYSSIANDDNDFI